MLEQHVTKDGDRLLIAEMEDEHLLNTIKVFTRQAKKLNAAAHAKQASDPYLCSLYGVRNIDPETAAQGVRMAIIKMYPYLAEAWFRRLNDDELHDMLAEILGRDGQMEIQIVPLLPDPVRY